MSEVYATDDDELDLIEFFEILWDGKYKIIGVIVFYKAYYEAKIKGTLINIGE